MGRVEAIWLKRARRGPMDPVERVELIRDRGMVGNANQGGRRQVTVIERESWLRMMDALDAALDPSARRANLMVSGISLHESRGRVLSVGSSRVAILGETRPCERMDEALPGLRDAMRPDWNGGVFGVVLEGGLICVGDAASMDEAEIDPADPFAERTLA